MSENTNGQVQAYSETTVAKLYAARADAEANILTLSVWE